MWSDRRSKGLTRFETDFGFCEVRVQDLGDAPTLLTLHLLFVMMACANTQVNYYIYIEYLYIYYIYIQRVQVLVQYILWGSKKIPTKYLL